MLYTVWIAICLTSVPAVECGRPTAVHWIAVPEQARSQSGCLSDGLRFAASSHLVSDGSYPKVFCKPGPNLAALRH